eukprot:CAMPEP_0177648320 /NCGR_PEP_ID=MMETSP0447-20121125/10766_1 /TAXON_ID=0 /ORGANISM="Stygamoeba regulata, Strain BSH-02190019" /LENGTH=726 /DNA_ID=CAMNT_0019150955 /DNA_START=464 /DNA_END=2644 /DNA_ORIENTATION=-
MSTLKAPDGRKIKHPVIIIPGFCCSALEAWETPEKKWMRECVWVNITKLGFTKMMNFLNPCLAAEAIEDTVDGVFGKLQLLFGKEPTEGGVKRREKLQHLSNTVTDVIGSQGKSVAPLVDLIFGDSKEASENALKKEKAQLEKEERRERKKEMLIKHVQGSVQQTMEIGKKTRFRIKNEAGDYSEDSEDSNTFLSSKRERWISYVQGIVGSAEDAKKEKDASSVAAKFLTKKRMWVRHMLLINGVEDPPGIKLRPVPSFDGIACLMPGPLVGEASYVFLFVIEAMAMMGYNPDNFAAMSYDWRLPPAYLEVRDWYYSRVKLEIERMYFCNHRQPVCILAHSMGNRTAQYFLWWVEKLYPGWSAKFVHTFIACGAPWLGAYKTARCCVAGDEMGLELFLYKKEGVEFARSAGSTPFLLPIDVDDMNNEITTEFLHLREVSGTKHEAFRFDELCAHLGDERVQETRRRWYENDDNYLRKRGDVVPVLAPPPVPRILNVHGINKETECKYWFRTTKDTAKGGVLKIDTWANPPPEMGITYREGFGYENKDRPQRFAKMLGRPSHCASGDGTVHYESLVYPEVFWKNWPGGPQILSAEIPDCEHREMLKDQRFFDVLADYLTSDHELDLEKKGPAPWARPLPYTLKSSGAGRHRFRGLPQEMPYTPEQEALALRFIISVMHAGNEEETPAERIARMAVECVLDGREQTDTLPIGLRNRVHKMLSLTYSDE